MYTDLDPSLRLFIQLVKQFYEVSIIILMIILLAVGKMEMSKWTHLASGRA